MLSQSDLQAIDQRIEFWAEVTVWALAVLLHNQDERLTAMAADLTALQNEVAQNGDVIASAVTLLQGLKAALDEALASGDPAAIQAVVDQLDAQTQSLADAVAANTPTTPAP